MNSKWQNTQIEEVKESLIDMVESQLLKNIEKGNQRAIEYYLIHRKKDRYSKKQNIKVKKPLIFQENVFVEVEKPTENKV